MTKREELIDFYKWCKRNDIDHNIDIRIERIVDEYLKSNNSSTSDEALTLGNNEQKIQICTTCGKQIFKPFDCWTCDECWRKSF